MTKKERMKSEMEAERKKENTETENAKNGVPEENREADAAKMESEAERIRKEYESYRRETERENLKRGRAEQVKNALRGAGVKREEFVALLTENMTLRGLWEKEDFDAERVAKECRERYGACFCETGMRGIDTVTPPVDPAGAADEDEMSDEEYYRRRWKMNGGK